MLIELVMGCIVGLMQLIAAPSSELYANVFETSAALLMSFLGMFWLDTPFCAKSTFSLTRSLEYILI